MPDDEDVAWADATLFSGPARVLSDGRRFSRKRQGMHWAALPVGGATRRLVPCAGRFAVEAFANEHDAMPPNRRRIGRAARAAARVGALRVAPQWHADRSLVFEDGARSVVAVAAGGMDRSVASCAITLGPRRYNRKPVVQLIDESAHTIGFLKVGADPITSAMVATETAAIDRLQVETAGILAVPRVLWSAEWQGRAAACLSPVMRGCGPLVPADRRRLIQLAAAVVEAGGGPEEVAFAHSEPVRRLQQLECDLGPLAEAVRMFGDRPVTAGLWHGDFSPWNMISTADQTALIDWEFSCAGMPVGADLLHNRLMVATHLRGAPVDQPLADLLVAGNDIAELDALRVPTEQHRLHLLLYLFELIRRDHELERAMRPTTGFGRAAHRVATRIIDQANAS